MTKRCFGILTVIIAIVHIGLVLFFGMKKEGFHEDEYYTYWSVSVTGGALRPYNFTWKSGYELQSRFFVSDAHRFDYGMVVRNQAEDVHPPLYYMALHTFMSLFPNSFYKWFGILLNLFFSLVSYGSIVALFYHMGGEHIRQREYAALLAGFVYAVAPSTVSAVMLTRMYAMSTMWSILYTLIFVLLMKNRQCDRRKFGIMAVAGAVTCYCAFLTHYFALLIPFFLTAAYSVYTLFCRKGIVRMLVWGVACVGAIGLAVLSYPASLHQIFGGYRGTGALSGLLDGALPVKLSIFKGYMQSWIFSGTMYPCLIVFVIALVALLVLIIRKDGWKNVHNFVCRMLAVLFALVLSYIFLCGTALIVGSAACRYFYPVAALFFPYMAYTAWCAFSVLEGTIGQLQRLCARSPVIKRAAAVCITAFALVPALFGYYRKNVLFLYEDDAEKVAFAREYSEYPLILVYNPDHHYRSWYVDDQVWPFEQVFYMMYDEKDALDDETLRSAEKIVVYMDAPEDLLEQLIADNPNLSGYTMARHDPFFYIYLLE